MRRRKNIETKYDELEERYSKLLGEKAELELSLKELMSSAEQIRRQDGEIRELHEKVRSIKHDMKNHLMVIVSYLNDNDDESARAYISKILDKLNAVHSYVETGNSLMNHILNEKLNLARQKGISIKAEIENLSFAKMESFDFASLLSNILDNAIEASLKESISEIEVVISQRRGYETILVRNKTEDSVLEKNPGLLTTKQDKQNHGMGIVQIREITEKYGGMCDFYEEDGFFCVYTFIPA